MAGFNSNNTGSIFHPGSAVANALAAQANQMARQANALAMANVNAVKQKESLDFVVRGHGQRTPEVNKRLGKLRWPESVRHRFGDCSEYTFNKLTCDVAIQHLGDYNPIYGGTPKKLAMALLMSAANPSRFGGAYALHSVGLVYPYPSLVGVRRMRHRTSVAGLALLDHWAEKFPKFKPFVDAYVTSKDRKKITAECYDLAMGVRPLSFIAADAKNEVYAKRAEEKRKKEQLIRAQKDAMYKAYAQGKLPHTWSSSSSSAIAYPTITSATTAIPTLATKPSILSRLFGKV